MCAFASEIFLFKREKEDRERKRRETLSSVFLLEYWNRIHELISPSTSEGTLSQPPVPAPCPMLLVIPQRFGSD